MKLQFIAGIAVIAAFCNASASSFYVATDGNDANDGLSSQTAFLTLAKAVEVATNSTEAAVADPGFTDVATMDYSLTKSSPLINKGTDYAAAGGISAFDLTGVQPRTVGSRVDIGCYEGYGLGLFIVVR